MIVSAATPDTITAFLRQLDEEASENPTDGEWLFANGESVFRCTSSARRVAEAFGGRVVGFCSDENPTAEIAAGEDGHDFALLAERFVVDYWATYAAGVTERPIWDLFDQTDAATISRLYGPREAWRTLNIQQPSPKP